MVKCNVSNCQEFAPVQISTGEEWLHLCREHHRQRDAGVPLDIDMDEYQKFANMPKENPFEEEK